MENRIEYCDDLFFSFKMKNFRGFLMFLEFLFNEKDKRVKL